MRTQKSRAGLRKTQPFTAALAVSQGEHRVEIYWIL